MEHAILILAQMDEDMSILGKTTPHYDATVTAVVIIIGSGLVLALVLFFGVYYYRRRRAARRYERKFGRPRPAVVSVETSSEAGEKTRVRKKYRERIREHRPRNPTLQETGGLPPLRSESDLPKG